MKQLAWQGRNTHFLAMPSKKPRMPSPAVPTCVVWGEGWFG